MKSQTAAAYAQLCGWGLKNYKWRKEIPAEYAKWHKTLLHWNHYTAVADGITTG